MRRDLLILDPLESTSILEPLSALDVFMAAPHRWYPKLLDQSLDSIRVLATSGLQSVLRSWARDRGFRFDVADGSTPWFQNVAAVLVFDPTSAQALGGLLGAMNIDVICFDLAQGTFKESGPNRELVEIMAIEPPRMHASSMTRTS